MMKTFSMVREVRAVLVATTLAIAAIVYALVPPPPAGAFEAQSSWGGTAGGSANALTVTIRNVQNLGNLTGVPIRFIPASDNTAATTVAVGGMTATALKRPSSIGLVDLSGAELKAAEPTCIVYTGSVFVLSCNVDMTPIGRTVEYRGSATPRGTLIEDGSCVSQTTYAALFSVISTNYGSCSAGQFALPDSRGRMFAALDNQGVNGAANKITSAGSGCTATAIGSCGFENATLTQLQLPNVTLVTSTSLTNFATLGTGFALGGGSSAVTALSNSGGGGTTSAVPSGLPLSVPLGGAGNAHATLNPISLGRRAIKY